MLLYELLNCEDDQSIYRTNIIIPICIVRLEIQLGQILPTSPPHQEASIASTRCSAQPYELSFPTFWRSAQYTIQLVPSPLNSGPYSKCNMRVASSSIALLQGILVTNKPRHQSLPRRAAALKRPCTGAPSPMNTILHRGSELPRRMYPTSGSESNAPSRDGL